MAQRKKMTPARMDKMIELLENGNTISFSCEELGVSRQTEWLARKTDDAYRERVDKALESRNEMVVDALYATALGGNFNAQRFFLINRDNKNWKSEQYLHVSGDEDGPPVNVAITEIVVEHPGDDDDDEQIE